MNLKNITTLNDIARARAINYHTLRTWLIKSKIKTERAGTTILIRKQDVKKILAAGAK